MLGASHVQADSRGAAELLWDRANALSSEVLGKEKEFQHVSEICRALNAVAQSCVDDLTTLEQTHVPDVNALLKHSALQLGRFADMLDRKAGMCRHALGVHKLVMTQFPFSWLPVRPRVAFGEHVIHGVFNGAKAALDRSRTDVLQADQTLRDAVVNLSGGELVLLMPEVERLTESLSRSLSTPPRLDFD
jgi:hypothetical protein